LRFAGISRGFLFGTQLNFSDCGIGSTPHFPSRRKLALTHLLGFCSSLLDNPSCFSSGSFCLSLGQTNSSRCEDCPPFGLPGRRGQVVLGAPRLKPSLQGLTCRGGGTQPFTQRRFIAFAHGSGSVSDEGSDWGQKPA